MEETVGSTMLWLGLFELVAALGFVAFIWYLFTHQKPRRKPPDKDDRKP